MNGTLGTIEKWNEQHQRWEVRLDVDGKKKALKETNISTEGVEQPAPAGEETGGGGTASGPPMQPDASPSASAKGGASEVPLAVGVRVRIEGLSGQ